MNIPPPLRSRNYTVNRYLVDKFFNESVEQLPDHSKILDVGGHKKGKVGTFDIARYPVVVEYVNTDSATEPDYLCDAADIPVDDLSYDCVIIAEVLEHVRDPVAVLNEAYRVLKSGGVLLTTSPFMYHVHSDPHDYGRYTGHWYQERLADIGFQNIEVRRQGLFFYTLANQVKLWSMCSNSRFERFLLRRIAYYLIHRAQRDETSDEYRKHWFFGSNVLAFAALATKPR